MHSSLRDGVSWSDIFAFIFTVLGTHFFIYLLSTFSEKKQTRFHFYWIFFIAKRSNKMHFTKRNQTIDQSLFIYIYEYRDKKKKKRLFQPPFEPAVAMVLTLAFFLLCLNVSILIFANTNHYFFGSCKITKKKI